MGEKRLTLALAGGELSVSLPGHSTLEEIAIGYELGGPQRQSGWFRENKISCILSGIEH
jgi:hypothetical protein